ncbi:hypothetical protein BOX15_Mlig015297g1 [Macrostomum lignano]|uniref:WSC domain-containing protein n=1 Tax=Macrostomum lignano TaxID=282301 RepID=A0A267FUN3_9PLAT|nr:hypothetical protein BOX15_Mlig015297g1 [Macrostomum lignano]
MFRTVLLLFCMSAAIYGALSCPSSKKKSEPDAAPETKEDPPKDRSDWPSENQFHPAEPDATPETKEDPPKDRSDWPSENQFHPAGTNAAPTSQDTSKVKTTLEDPAGTNAAPTSQDTSKVKTTLEDPAGTNAAPTSQDTSKVKTTLEDPAGTSAAPSSQETLNGKSAPEDPVQSFNGIGCYLITNKVNNEVKLEMKQNIKMSHRVCALECARKSPLKRYKYFGLANGDNCLCASELPRNSSIVDNPEVHCSYRCPGNHLQSCGGENAAAYFSVSATLSSMRKDKFEQGAKVYPVIPASVFPECYDNQHDLTKVLQSNEMSHLVCASECVRRDLYGKKFKYFAITDFDTCFCASTLPTLTEKTKNSYCSYRCPGNHNQSCGGDHKIAYFNLTTTTVPPKKDTYEQGPWVTPILPENISMAACAVNMMMENSDVVSTRRGIPFETCAQRCISVDLYDNYKYFFIRDDKECVCAPELPEYSDIYPDSDCKGRCPRIKGSLEFCGNQDLLAFFNLIRQKPDQSKSILPTPDQQKQSQPESVPATPDPRAQSVTQNPRDPIGCYSIYQGYPMAKLELINKEKMSHRVCAFECRKKNALKKFKYFSLAFGDSCLCASELPHDSYRLSIEKDCSIRCPASHMESCGGESGAAYFSLSTITNSPNIDKFEQGAKVYPVIPASDSLKCYENPYELTKVLQSDDEMSHLVCASECVRRDLYGKKFKYFAIANGDRCFCESELPPAEYKTKNKNEKCSYRCPRNDKQSCGGPGGIVYFKLEITNTPPESDKKKQGAKVYPAIPNSPFACYLYVEYLSGPKLKSDNMSHLVCATECVRRDLYFGFKYFAIANGDRCFCESELPPAKYKKELNETCSYRCPRNDKQSCGGPEGIVYFKLETTNTPPESDEKKQGAKIYPAIPNSPIQCYRYYDGTGKVRLTSNEMSHLICATECVKRDLYGRFKYFAIANGDRCFCESELPPVTNKAQLNETCSYRCQQNDKQSCGSPLGIVYFKLEITNTPPESDEKKQGAKIYPAIPNSPTQCYQYDGKGIVRLTSNEMSHLICATECVKRDLYGRFKYFAIANGDRCFCESELPPASEKIPVNEHCSFRCPRNFKQICGSGTGIVYFKLETTNTPHKSDN